MSLRQRVKAEDARLLRVFAAPHHSRRRGLTRQLVPLGDHLKAWLFVSPALVVAGGRGRRAALAGWEAVAVAACWARLSRRAFVVGDPGGERYAAG